MQNPIDDDKKRILNFVLDLTKCKIDFTELQYQ